MLSLRLRHIVAGAMLAGAALATTVLSTPVTRGGTSLAVRCDPADCPGGPTNSFTADTLVLMADGSTRRIADVRPGDQITTNGRTAPQTVVAVVVGTGDKDLVEIASGAGSVTATANHRFWVADRGGWRTAAELRVGDRLGDVRVTGLRRTTRLAAVYNLDVTGPQTFTVEVGDRPVLVHE
ncbi:Hint domain-containing protein [Dactylosporangium sp. CA-052675]|uniref:Hint domain-containing protein n=1 Tax=Dactylosporangium sp. CA-052675 TaxID=3239927 RepID=UPI003D914B0C